jgi:hypothetical protein
MAKSLGFSVFENKIKFWECFENFTIADEAKRGLR